MCNPNESKLSSCSDVNPSQSPTAGAGITRGGGALAKVGWHMCGEGWGRLVGCVLSVGQFVEGEFGGLFVCTNS